MKDKFELRAVHQVRLGDEIRVEGQWRTVIGLSNDEPARFPMYRLFFKGGSLTYAFNADVTVKVKED